VVQSVLGIEPQFVPNLAEEQAMLEFFDQDLRSIDPDVAGLIGYEAERQARKLIMIPSESQAPAAVRMALGSGFQNLYAEGYPDPATIGLSEEAILDYEMQMASYRRFGDQRYYKGVEYANILEALARRRLADAAGSRSKNPRQRPAALACPRTTQSCRVGPGGSTIMEWTCFTAAT
jgi:hypothetical protein